ncbi:MAG TPA: hypothetical protein VH206_16605 [Xanthobacteraceae bacterium]|jgi:hypothetical protein|nr:hypothetical protein [Xanthobacteraceae bacterium]
MRQHKRSGFFRSGLLALGISVALTAAATVSAGAQDAPKITRSASNKTPVVTSGSGPYYIEFRARYAWDYGHTYIVHGRVGEAPTKASVAGLSPVGDDATAWVIGHYVPVPAETGWTDGDLEDKYVTARYRVLMSKDQYDRTMGFVRDLQSRSHTWSAELYNCNAFVGDVAKFMGMKVPASSLIYPKIFVTHMRLMNTGHPDADETLTADNVKEMSNPTRDGRAMINNKVYTIRPDGTPASQVAASSPPPAAPSPAKVSIGSMQVSGKPAHPAAATAPSN